jgi:hypothetical protein
MSWFYYGRKGWFYSYIWFDLECKMSWFRSYVRLENGMGQILGIEDVIKRGVRLSEEVVREERR